MTIKEKSVNEKKVLLLEVFDLTEAYKLSRDRLQKEFQCLLTNALSHERLTPLNTIVNISEIKLRKLESTLKDQDIGKKLHEKKSDHDQLDMLKNLNYIWSSAK